MKKAIWLVSGVFAGVTLVLACETGGDGSSDGGHGGFSAGSDASAAPSDCKQWQVFLMDYDDLVSEGEPPAENFVNSRLVPPGWEPLGQLGQGLLLRKCVP